MKKREIAGQFEIKIYEFLKNYFHEFGNRI